MFLSTVIDSNASTDFIRRKWWIIKAMNEQEAKDRIRQMISFVQEEAKDKAREIETRTEHEYNAAKSKHLFQAKERLIAENEKLWKKLEIKRRIDKSAAINAARMEIMKARSECMTQLVEETRAKLIHNASNSPAEYKEVLENLIIQGLIKLLEPQVTVQCRACDLTLVQDVLEPAKNRYLNIIRTSTGREYDLRLDIDTRHLPPGPHEGSHGVSCSGGVILHSHNGKIRCINTLDERLTAIVAANTPALRKMLF